MTFHSSLSLVAFNASVALPALSSHLFMLFSPVLHFHAIIQVVTRCSCFSFLITFMNDLVVLASRNNFV